MERGGQPGNQNASKGKPWAQAIERALAKRSKGEMVAALDDLAEKLLVQCDQGEMTALKELGDRLDGKAAQPIVGDVTQPVIVNVLRFSDGPSK